MGCLTEAQLRGLAEGALTPGAERACRQHLGHCLRCGARLARGPQRPAATPVPCAPGRATPSRTPSTRSLGEAAAPSGTVLLPPATPPPPADGGGAPALLPAAPLQPGAPAHGTLLGRYLLLERLGAGGMGQVYAAYDPRLDRKVAVKLLLPHPADATAEARARLLREAQAMARLAHPHVLPVHDAGEVDGRVFIAMGLVEGATTLRAWLGGAPRSWREVVRVFLDAGRGLAAAHRAGLVHRDFKPDNVLLDREGRVFVTDFGLARTGAEWPADPLQGPGQGAGAAQPPPSSGLLGAAVTRADSLVGTPGYMAPEQWRGEGLDGRADQFAFCASLYLALWGLRPFSGGGPQALHLQAAQGQVRPPPREPRVPARLRQAVLRGLSAEREARFPDMEALLAVLADDPRVRLRRAAAPAGLALLCALALGTPRLLALRAGAACRAEAGAFSRAWDGARQAQVEAALRGSGRPYATDAWLGVKGALDGYGAAWARMQEEACVATRVEGEASERVLGLRTACLEERVQAARALTEVLARADAAVAERAVEAARSLPALSPCADVDALVREGPPPPGAAEARAELRAELARAHALHETGRYREAAALAAGLAGRAARGGHAALEAEALHRAGAARMAYGEPGPAEADLKAALHAAERAGSEGVKARALLRLVNLLGWEPSRTREAHEWSALAHALLSRMPGEGALLAELHSLDGATWRTAGDHRQAEAASRRALEVLSRTGRTGGPEAGLLHHFLGAALERQGRYGEALVEHRRAVALTAGALGPEHPRMANLLGSMGAALDGLYRLEEALEVKRRALAIEERALAPDALAVAISLNNVASTLMRMRRYAESVAPLERSLALRERAFGPGHSRTVLPRYNLGYAHARLGNDGAAWRHYAGAMAVARRALPPRHAYVGHLLQGMGDVRARQRAWGEALPLLERALALRESLQSAPDELGETRASLGRALWESGRQPRRARALLARAWEDLSRPGGEPLLEDFRAWLRRAGLPVPPPPPPPGEALP
jgi:tetratricopeptide (TPR) repeat protein